MLKYIYQKEEIFEIFESKIKNSKIVHQVIFDRIELGTYMIASALLAKKSLIIDKINPNIIKKWN